MTSVCYIIIRYEYMQAALFPLSDGVNACMYASTCIRPPAPLNNFNSVTPTTYSLPEQIGLSGGHLKHNFCSLQPLASCSATAILPHFSINCLPSRLYLPWYHHRVLQRSIVCPVWEVPFCSAQQEECFGSCSQPNLRIQLEDSHKRNKLLQDMKDHQSRILQILGLC